MIRFIPLLIILSGCGVLALGEILTSDAHTKHIVSIHNASGKKLEINVESNPQIEEIGYSLVEIALDTIFFLDSSSSQILYELTVDNFESQSLELEDILTPISKINFLQNQEDVTPDLWDSKNWDITWSDPLPFPDTVLHNYRFIVNHDSVN